MLLYLKQAISLSILAVFSTQKPSKHALQIKPLIDQYLQTLVPSLELELAEADGCKQQQQQHGSMILTGAWPPFLLTICAYATAAARFL